MESPFDALDIDSDADDEEIERAYRERVKQAHPDHGGSVEEFRAVRAAYEKLKAGYRQAGGRATRARGREPNQVPSRVTYLDYDVLTDFGWEVDDPNLFERAAAENLQKPDFGGFRVPVGKSLLEAAEANDLAWPFACRGGACANCAIMLFEGELSMPVSHVLPADLMERGIRLSCNGMPLTDELKVVYNVKHVPDLDELLLPPQPFEQAYSDD